MENLEKMLYEIKGVKQNPDEDKRRWFTDNEFWDLYIWQNNKSEITGMQLCYNRSFNERALTWFKNRMFNHTKVSQGEGYRNSTPILVADGNLDKKIISKKFKEDSQNLEKKIVNFVLKKISEFIK